MPAAMRAQDAQQYSGGKTIPAPVGGMNARDALANMPETDAIILDNVFPQPSWVETRGGAKTLAKFTGQCETLAAYNAINGSNQLYAAVVNGSTHSIYRVDNAAGGTVTVPVVGGAGSTVEALTSTRFDYSQFGTAAAEALWLVNGADNGLVWDGTVWTAVTGASVPYAVTGVATSLLWVVQDYHQRLFFLQKNSFNVWYLPIGSIGGAAAQIPLAAYFKLGGYLATIVTVSIDNAQGLNDYIAFISNVGEVVVFNGTDPSSASTFVMSAHFRIGRPIGTGKRCWQKIGSDAAIITADGLVLMSEALLTDRSQTKNAVSDKIRYAITTDVTSYANNFGWQVQLYPIGNKVLVNVPTTENQASYTYVMNTLTNAWCTFGKYLSPWNPICFEVMNDAMYYGTNGAVKQCDTNTIDDDGAAISCLAQPAYSYFDKPGELKRWQMARPIFKVNGTLAVGITLSVDFNNALPTGTVPVSMGNAAIWNVSLWTTPTFWGDATIISKNWVGAGGLGYAATIVMQYSALDVRLQWQATDYIFEEGGLV